jgi:hypothetical protein
MVGDVLEEALTRAYGADHVCDERPEMSWIILGGTPSGDTEWLARIAANDAIHDSAPSCAVEGFKIRPYRRRSQGFIFHARSQDFAAVGFDVNIADRSSISDCQIKSEFLSCESGADG